MRTLTISILSIGSLYIGLIEGDIQTGLLFLILLALYNMMNPLKKDKSKVERKEPVDFKTQLNEVKVEYNKTKAELAEAKKEFDIAASRELSQAADQIDQAKDKLQQAITGETMIVVMLICMVVVGVFVLG